MIHQPPFVLFITVLAYAAGRHWQERSGQVWAQPALIAIVALSLLILVLRVPYQQYLAGAQLLSFGLGPATVALAVPLHRQAHHLAGYVIPLVVALVTGTVVSVGTGILVVRALGGPVQLARTMAPKSATAPVSLALSSRLGGIPALSAVFTILIGVTGAVLGPWFLDRLRIMDKRARGLALGAVSHGIGTSRAMAQNETEGAFAGLSMGLTALLTCVVAPVLVPLLT